MTSVRQLTVCVALAVSLSLGGALLSGCLPAGKPKLSEKVQEPPYIPALPEAPAGEPSDKTVDGEPIRMYADLLETADRRWYHPQLQAAVSRAVDLGVLKPLGPHDRFEPARPVTYGEFRSWALAYQRALSGGQTTDALPRASLPVEMGWGQHRLAAGKSLNREELCALYVFLAGQEPQAKLLGQREMEAMSASGDPMDTDETFVQFQDYTAIGPWARPAVALAYRDGVLQTVFGLTPNHLTVGDGLAPEKTVSRQEALVLLHHLYGQVTPVAASQQPVSTDEEATKPAGDDILGKPKPVKTLTRYSEKGPAGSRSALQVNGPD